jgi:hypothetical protein
MNASNLFVCVSNFETKKLSWFWSPQPSSLGLGLMRTVWKKSPTCGIGWGEQRRKRDGDPTCTVYLVVNTHTPSWWSSGWNDGVVGSVVISQWSSLTTASTTRLAIVGKLLQWQQSFCPVCGGGGGGVLGVFFWLLGLLLPKGFGCSLFFFLFWMAPFMHPPSIQDIPCLHCYGFYTLSDLSKHVKSAHLPTSLVP